MVGRQRLDPSLPMMAGEEKGYRACFFRQGLTRSYGFEDEDADQSCKLITRLRAILVEVTAWRLSQQNRCSHMEIQIPRAAQDPKLLESGGATDFTEKKFHVALAPISL